MPDASPPGPRAAGQRPDRETGGLGLKDLFVIFLKAGLAFGGGLGILAVLEDELVKRRGAVSPDAFLAIYGIGRIVPSGTMTALAVAYGYQFAGLPGTVVTLTALTLPAFTLTVVLTVAYGVVRGGPLLEVLPVTLLPAALALILSAALRLGRHVARPSWELVLALAAFALSRFLHLNPSLILIGGGLLGLVLLRGKGRG